MERSFPMKIIEPSQAPLAEDRYDRQFILALDSMGRGADVEVPKNLVVAKRPTDFAEIKDPRKNILLYAWAPSAELLQVIEETRPASLPALSLTVPSEEIGQVAARAADPLARWMLEELVDVLRGYAALVPEKRVTIAFCKTREQSCPLFHIDRLSVRLLCTFKGPGTEWLDDAQAQRRWLGRGDNRKIAGPEAIVYSTQPFQVCLLKGEHGLGQKDCGVVHRSPRVPPASEGRWYLRVDTGWS
jgi:hypothetical protein